MIPIARIFFVKKKKKKKQGNKMKMFIVFYWPGHILPDPGPTTYFVYVLPFVAFLDPDSPMVLAQDLGTGTGPAIPSRSV